MTFVLRPATLEDVPHFEKWGREPHVIAATSDDPNAVVAFEDAEWREEISNGDPASAYFVAEVDGHPIGAMHNTHHGTTNAVCMPEVLKLNAPAIRDRFDRLAAYLDIPGGYDGFCTFVDAFNDSFSIPKNLTELGVTNPDIDALTEAALRDPSCGGNPVELTRDNVRGLFEALI